MKKEKGFTIIELVVVILLLGILAATALPRFTDVSDQAHLSVIDGVQGGLNSGYALFKAQWMAEGMADDGEVDGFPGGLFANADGYPVGTTDNSLDDAANGQDCAEVFDLVLQSGHPGVTSIAFASDPETTLEAAALASPDAGFVAMPGSATPTVCNFYYVGQYRSGASGDAARDIPYLIYDSTTGTVSKSPTALTLNTD